MKNEILNQVFSLWSLYKKDVNFDSNHILESISLLLLVKKYCDGDWETIVGIPSPEEQLKQVEREAFPRLMKCYEHHEVFHFLFHPTIFSRIPPALCRRTILTIESIFKQSIATASSFTDEIYEEIYNALISCYDVSYDTGGLYIPQHITKFMTVLADIRPGDEVFDPNCRLGGFLVEAYKQKLINSYKTEGVQARLKEDQDGFEMISPALQVSREFREKNDVGIQGLSRNDDEVRLAFFNLLFNGVINAVVAKADFIMCPPRQDFDVILSNPPFGLKVDVGSEFRIDSTSSEIQFIDLLSSQLKPGGRAVIIVPESFLTNNVKAFIECRHFLLQENRLEAVISLPPGIFQPSSSCKAAILYFEKSDRDADYATREVWFYELGNDGYSLDLNRRRLKGSPLPEVVDLFRKRYEKPNYDCKQNGFFVRIEEIEKNSLALSFNRYRDFAYKDQTYEVPSKILDEIEEQEKEIMVLLNDLKNKVEWK